MKVPYIDLGELPAGTVVEVVMRGGEGFVEVLDDNNLALLMDGQAHTYFGGQISGTFQCALPTTGIWYVLGVSTGGPGQAEVFTTPPTPTGAMLPWAHDARPIETRSGHVPDGIVKAAEWKQAPGDLEPPVRIPEEPIAYTAEPFTSLGIEEGGRGAKDNAGSELTNKQNMRGAEGVPINGDRISEILHKSNDELSTIGTRTRQIGQEYEELGVQKFATRGDGRHREAPDLTGDEDSGPAMEDVAQWYLDWDELNKDVATHNAAVAAHTRTKPPLGSHISVVTAYNLRAAELNSNAQRLYDKQLELAAQTVELGISAVFPEPPLEVG